MKRISILILSILFLGFYSNKTVACHGLPLVNYSFNVGATGVTVNGSSNAATCGCGPYWMQVEVSCSPVFTGNMPTCLTTTLINWNVANGTTYTSYPYYQSLLNIPAYTGPAWMDNCVVEPYHSVFIPFNQFCPGSTMFFRAREVIAGGGPSFGPWTAVSQFVVPGTLLTPTCTPNLTHTPPTTPGSPACVGTPFVLNINNLNCLTTCGGTLAPSCVPTTTVFYKWRSNPANPSTPTITSLPTLNVPIVNTTTTFSVWAIDSCSVPGGACAKKSLCVNTNTVWPLTTTIYINNVTVMASFPAPPNQCLNGNNFSFNAVTSPGTSYNWNFGDGNLGAGASVNHSYAAPGTYTVSLTASNPAACAPNTVTQVVTVYPMPVITAGNSGPVCAGLPLNLTSNGAVNYSWSGPGGFNSALQNPSIASPAVNQSGIYTVTGTDANGCVGTATTNVVINPGAPLNISNTGPVCSGNNISMTVSGSNTYTWSGPGNFSSNQSTVTFNNAAASVSGIYTVTATSAGGCISTATTQLVVNPTPTVTITNSGPVCNGNTINLSANGGGTYQWSGPGGFTSTQANITINNATSNNAGVYTVTVTSTEGCTSVASTTVVVYQKPSCSVTASSPVCVGDELRFTTTENLANAYSWTGPNGFVSNQKNPKIPESTLNHNGTYVLTVTSDKGCTATASVNVIVNPLPNVNITSKNTSGCAPLCNVGFTATSTSNITKYEWSLGNGTTSSNSHIDDVCFYQSGPYSPAVTVVDNNGCRNTMATNVQVFPKPVADYKYSPNPINILNPLVNFTDISFGGDINTWFWAINPGNYGTFAQQNPSVTFQDTGVYAVHLVVTNTNGCKDTVSKAIYVYEDFMFYVPNAFTPNGDGQNDEFKPIITNVSNYHMIIFDRWGKEVFSTRDLNKGWDGNVKSKINNNVPTKQEVYIWRIEFSSKGKGAVHTGHVTLIK